MNDGKAASVRQRLLNRAKRDGEDYNRILARYVALRFLHRIAASKHSGDFLLKGATLFLVWGGNAHRPTRDIEEAWKQVANLSGGPLDGQNRIELL